VASYLGLIPREESSGGRQKLGVVGITFVVFLFVAICAAVWNISKRITAPYVPPDIRP